MNGHRDVPFIPIAAPAETPPDPDHRCQVVDLHAELMRRAMRRARRDRLGLGPVGRPDPSDGGAA